MKHREKLSTSSGSPEATDVADENMPKKPAQDESRAADDSVKKIDRPGFDLGGASDDTHAGTGLGLGSDASDTPGDGRLPGRRPDNKLTIPRWGGPEPHGTTMARPHLLRNRQAPKPHLRHRRKEGADSGPCSAERIGPLSAIRKL